MYIPEAYPTIERPAVRKRLFGVSACPTNVYLTPSRTFFRQLARGLKRASGWWECALNDRVFACLTPQGSPVLDAVSSLEPGTSITFLGFCGSLGKQSLAAILEPEIAWLGASCFKRHHHLPRLFHSAPVITVPALIYSWEPKLAEVAELTDLETAYIFSVARHQKKFARSIMVVSDVLPVHPFFAAGPRNVIQAVCHAIAAVLAQSFELQGDYAMPLEAPHSIP
jgi:hypothetical protein